MSSFSRRIELGTLFDDLADLGHATTVHLGRPLDIAPDMGTGLNVPALARLVRDAAGWFAAGGARPGDRVAVCKRDHWDVVLLCCAAARIGAVPVPLSAHLDPDVLETLLKRLDPALLVVDSAWPATGRAPDGLAGRTLFLGPPGSGPHPASALTLDDVRGHAAPAPYLPPVDDPVAIVHTSGTTGVPKLVVHSTRTLLRRLAGFEARRWPVLASRPGDVVAAAFSFAHGRALAWTSSVLALGPEKVLVIPDGAWREARPLLERHRPTIVEAQPSTYVRWRAHASDASGGEGGAFERVRLYISTFDAVHPPTVRTFLNATRHPRPIWMQGWGQSETGPLTFRFLTRRALRAERERHPTTRDLGRPIPGRAQVRVVSPETLRPVPRGTPGLLVCHTKALCQDYVGERERYLRKRVGQWFVTGDLGVLTRPGRLLLLDREDDAVPEGSCVELEDVLEDRLPDIAECVVLSVPGNPSVPVLVTDGGEGAVDSDRWRDATADLPELAEPVVTAWDGVPRTATGKVRRAALRARLGLSPESYGTGKWT